MGVDYYPCTHCGDTFCECGYYVICETCDQRWCTDECAEKDGFRYEDEDRNNSTCKFCRGEDTDDTSLLDFCLKQLGKTREEIVKDYFKEEINVQ